MKRALILAFAALSYFGVNAQSEEFPLFFSQYGMNGTAAYIGKAGAIGALGGDIMAAQYNPAGLGLYRSSEISFSFGIDAASSKTTWNNLSAKDNHPTFNYGNIGMVLDFNNGKSPFRHVQVSFGVNRLMNFNNRTKVYRNGLSSSFVWDNVEQQLINDYANNPNGIFKDDWYQSYVIDFDTTNGQNSISSIFDGGNGDTYSQIRTFRESGSLDEFSMSLSTNYENWLYLGMTMGIPFGDYTCKTTLTEVIDQTGDSYTYSQEQRLSATGINLKLGAIVRPTQWLRLGAAIHTPTWYNVTDDYYRNVTFVKSAGGWFPTFEYYMQSPWRFMGSAAIILGSSKTLVQGTISADYEYADYSFMSYSIDDSPMLENSLNNNIENMFGGASTLRIGGELRYSNLRARVGYANFGNPFKGEDINTSASEYITCGIGFRGKIFSFDLAYAYGTTNNRNVYSYDVYDINADRWYGDDNPAKSDRKHSLIQATFAIRF